MDFSTLPDTAFIHPAGKNHREIVALLTQVATQIADHLANAASQPPVPTVATLPAIALPDDAVDFSVLLAQISHALATAMNPAHPGYLGHMDPLPTTASIVGDWVAAALNNNLLSVEMSPFFSRLEPLLLQEIAQLFGLGDRAGGLLVSGGSLANLQALAVARNAQLHCLEKGLTGRAKAPVFFVSAAAHTSFQKAAMLLGLGTQGAIAIPTNDQSQMAIPALRQAIAAAAQAGQQPFALVATAGTTVTGSIDPLGELGAIAREY
ncbi:MAG TPA: pyridoxal-dependent decarboxylase, partial [Candidatus Obscuribacterales bacterium]